MSQNPGASVVDWSAIVRDIGTSETRVVPVLIGATATGLAPTAYDLRAIKGALLLSGWCESRETSPFGSRYWVRCSSSTPEVLADPWADPWADLAAALLATRESTTVPDLLCQLGQDSSLSAQKRGREVLAALGWVQGPREDRARNVGPRVWRRSGRSSGESGASSVVR